VFLERA
jgi:PAS domain S-box-containing protein